MTDLHTDVERYLRYLSVERQLSPITLLNYQRQLEAIINFASENMDMAIPASTEIKKFPLMCFQSSFNWRVPS